MQIHIWKWDIFILFKIDRKNVFETAGVYLFDHPLQTLIKGQMYITGLRLEAWHG